MRGVWRIFISRRFAVSLLVLMLGLLILAILLPNPSILSPEEIRTIKEQRPYLFKITEILGIQGLTASPFFFVLPFLIFISTAICTWTRLQSRLKSGGAEIEGRVFKAAKEVTVKGEAKIVRSRFLKAFSSPLWSVQENIKEEIPILIAHRGRFGFWGSMLFHLGLLTVLLATIVTGLTLFTGEMLLTEGYPIPLKEEGFLKVWRRPFFGMKLPDEAITLEEFKRVFKDNKYPIDYIATVRVGEKDGFSFLKDIRVNDPLKYQGLQYNIDRYGFAPSFVIKGKDGKVLFDGDINLVLVGGQEDSFQIPDTDIGITVRFYPDFVMTKDGPRTRSDILNNPVFSIKVTREGIVMKQGFLYMGQEAEMTDIMITYTGIKYWVHILVARDWGAPVLFIGLVFLVIGLIARLSFYEKGLNVVINAEGENCIVKVSGYTKYFPAFFEREIKKIIEEVTK